MMIGGASKDWLLIGLSAYFYGAYVSQTSLIGYAIVFASVVYYQYHKYKVAMEKLRSDTAGESPANDAEKGDISVKEPLLQKDTKAEQ